MEVPSSARVLVLKRAAITIHVRLFSRYNYLCTPIFVFFLTDFLTRAKKSKIGKNIRDKHKGKNA